MNKIPGIKGAEFSEPVMRAYYFASAAHGAVRQVRKYTAEPYINHPVEVLGILSSYCGEKVNDHMKQAALLHDTIEDTGVDAELIRHLFGEEVARMVLQLSKATTASYGNRAGRHSLEVKRLSNACWEAQTVKVADLMSNTGSIVERDPAFAKTYLAEKALLLKSLNSALPEILEPARAMLGAMRTRLEVAAC